MNQLKPSESIRINGPYPAPGTITNSRDPAICHRATGALREGLHLAGAQVTRSAGVQRMEDPLDQLAAFEFRILGRWGAPQGATAENSEWLVAIG